MTIYVYLQNELLDQAADTYENLQYMHENNDQHTFSPWQGKLLLEMLANEEFRNKVIEKHKEKFGGQ